MEIGKPVTMWGKIPICRMTHTLPSAIAMKTNNVLVFALLKNDILDKYVKNMDV